MLLVLYYFLCINKVLNTKNISVFDSEIGLSSHCLCDKGSFARPKKASWPGYGARRPLIWKKIIELFLSYIASFCGFIVILL